MFKEDYDEHIKSFDVLEKDSKFYLRFKPDVLYDTREEAEKDIR